jgi:hypothetical protein
MTHTRPGEPELLTVWPEPPASPMEALEHTLHVHRSEPDDWMVVTATSGIYPVSSPSHPARTGLTLGDLRALHRMLRDR